MTTKSALWAAAILIVLVVTARFGTVAALRWMDAKRERIASLEASAAADRARADQYRDMTAKAIVRAAKAEGEAAALRKGNTIRKVMVVEPAIAAAPDTCAPVIGVLMEFADSLQLEADFWKDASDEKGLAIETLQSEATALRSEADSLREAKDIAKEMTKVSFWSKIKPSLGAGLAIGIDPETMEFEKVVGLTLDWNF